MISRAGFCQSPPRNYERGGGDWQANQVAIPQNKTSHKITSDDRQRAVHDLPNDDTGATHDLVLDDAGIRGSLRTMLNRKRGET